VEVVASLSQGRTAAAQCGFFTYKSVPVIFEPPCRKKMEREGRNKDRINDMLKTEKSENVYCSVRMRLKSP